MKWTGFVHVKLRIHEAPRVGQPVGQQVVSCIRGLKVYIELWVSIAGRTRGGTCVSLDHACHMTSSITASVTCLTTRTYFAAALIIVLSRQRYLPVTSCLWLDALPTKHVYCRNIKKIGFSISDLHMFLPFLVGPVTDNCGALSHE